MMFNGMTAVYFLWRFEIFLIIFAIFVDNLRCQAHLACRAAAGGGPATLADLGYVFRSALLTRFWVRKLLNLQYSISSQCSWWLIKCPLFFAPWRVLQFGRWFTSLGTWHVWHRQCLYMARCVRGTKDSKLGAARASWSETATILAKFIKV